MFDLSLFAFMGRDPASGIDFPLAFGIIMHEVGYTGAKAECISWLFEQWYLRKNPEIFLHIFDIDMASYNALRCNSVNRFKEAIEYYIESMTTEFHEVVRDIPECEREVALAYLKSLKDLRSQFSLRTEIAKAKQKSPLITWTTTQDMKNIVDDFEDWWQPSVIEEAYDILPGVLAVFLDRMCEIHTSSESKLVPKVGKDGQIKNESKDLSWMDWEMLIEDCDSLFFHIFSPHSELFAVLLKTVHKKARFCMFHVKKAWVDYCYNWFQKDRSVWAAIYKDMDDLAYAKTKEAFSLIWQRMESIWSHGKAKEVVDYLRKYYIESEWITV
jgi:hypothetical protein